MAKPVPLLVSLLALAAQPALAQTPADAFATGLRNVCSAAVPGTRLNRRCSEILSSPDPRAIVIAALGQRLAEIPGQARVATRDVAQSLFSTHADLGGHDLAIHFGSGDDGLLSLKANTEGGLAAPWSLYFSADVGSLERKTSRNEAAFDARTGSVTAGIDWQLGKNWQVGGAFNHVRENLDYSNSDSQARTRFSGLLFTTSRALGDTWSGSSYYGWYRGNYQLSRDISFSLPLPSGPLNFSAEADASPYARRRVSGISGNGQWSRRGWDLGVGLGLDKNDTTIAAYEETGGNGFDLRVPGRRISTRRGRVDFTVGRTFSSAHGVFQPSLRLGWRKEFSNVRRAVSVRLVEDSRNTPITFDTEDPDRNWGEVAIGGVMTFTHGHSGFFELRQRVAHSFLQERMLAIGWRIEM